jgi:hypothetical protein
MQERYHNYILRRLKESRDVTRIEIIDKSGRSYSNWNVVSHETSYQDDGRTLKIFIKEKE